MLAITFILARPSGPSPNLQLGDRLGATAAHTHPAASAPVDLLWAHQNALRARAARIEAIQYRRHLRHVRAVRRRRAKLAALRRQQRAQARSLGTAPAPSYSYHGPTATQAQRAVAFAYAQLGCPYVYGGTGPCQSGFDCSGLVMEAWAAAGVTIPRTSEEQLASLPQIPASDVQPGDLLIFDGGGHVGMYVGGGMLIDSPQPGETVEKVAWAGWYQATFVAAVRP
jgi:cell wall-associated NlpC family hydrolase